MIGAKINLHGESLPDGWSVQLVGDMGEYINGYPFKPTEWKDQGLPIIRIQNLNDAAKPFNYFHDRIDERYLVRDGDILISWSASLGTFLWRRGDAWLNQHIFKALPDETKIDRSFFYWAMVYAIDRIAKNARGSTMMHVTGKEFKGSEILLPSRVEQQKIADLLGLVQRAIEQQERLLALAAELKMALLHQLFTQGLRGEPQKQTEIGPVPKSWEERPLEKAGEVVYGIQAAVASNLKPIGSMILTNKNITLDGKIVLEKINYFVQKTKRHHETVLKKGDLLFNWRSGSKEHVGKTAYFDLSGEFVHSSFILRIRPSDKITGRYLFYYLNFLRGSGFFLKKQTYSVNAKFNKSAINDLATFLPDEEERQEIVDALDAVGRKLDALLAKNHLLEDFFRTLLHQLMTAQIRVHDLDLPKL